MNAYAVGYGGQIFRRKEEDGKWDVFTTGINTLEADWQSIAGHNDADLCVVGWGGLICHYAGSQWQTIESPTQFGLFRITTKPEGGYFACGQRGTVIESNDGITWKILDQNLTEEDFYGCAVFKNKLFLAHSNGLISYSSADGFAELEITGPKKIKITPNLSFYRLSATADCIWSVGEKMAIWSEDGLVWKEVGYKV